MKQSKYVSKQPDPQGWVEYTDEEQATWKLLYDRQMQILPDRACKDYLEGLITLEIRDSEIPQIPNINKKLKNLTGWQVAPVPALIGFKTFFEMLASKKFPAATFIRSREELDYLQEPDIFHEIFGHCPLITVPAYAEFMQKYGELGLQASKKDRSMLARLYWFTIEFGLIQTHRGLKIYGGGILSSHGESKYALDSDTPLRKPLDSIDAFRTPYRIDIFQPVYFVINSFDKLFDLTNEDLFKQIEIARNLGMYEPLFEPKADTPNPPC